MSTTQTYFKLSGNGNLGLLWFYFTMIYDWSRKFESRLSARYVRNRNQSRHGHLSFHLRSLSLISGPGVTYGLS